MEPFLLYTTLFRSRVAVANLLLPITSYGYSPSATLDLKIKEIVGKKILLNTRDEVTNSTLRYLIDKGLIGSKPRSSGRYKGYALREVDGEWIVESARAVTHELPAYEVDVWMSEDSVLSTTGAPTPDNANELLSLCLQLGLLSKAKLSWTSSGHLVNGLRHYSEDRQVVPRNPFVLGLEGVALLRQVLQVDGIFLCEVVREIVMLHNDVFSRDELVPRAEAIAERAYERLRLLPGSSDAAVDARRFLRLIRTTSQKRGSQSTAPGVLEHRLTPRLEWLTDFGMLSKAGLERNGFTYRRCSTLQYLLEFFEQQGMSQNLSDETSIALWQRDERWMSLRTELPALQPKDSLVEGYRIMKRPVGPTGMRDVVFAAAVVNHRANSVRTLTNELIDWSQADKRVQLSGGRYRGGPENVHIADGLTREVLSPR